MPMDVMGGIEDRVQRKGRPTRKFVGFPTLLLATVLLVPVPLLSKAFPDPGILTGVLLRHLGPFHIFSFISNVYSLERSLTITIRGHH